jgi:hypothetical protein
MRLSSSQIDLLLLKAGFAFVLVRFVFGCAVARLGCCLKWLF